MSHGPSQVPPKESVAVSASGASLQPPLQPQIANHGPYSQPAHGVGEGKRIIQENRTSKITSSPTFPQFSASTEAILKRVGKGSPAWDMAREIVLKGMVTTQTMPALQPATRGSRRGGRRGGSRGGRALTARAPLNGEANGSSTATPNSTPVSSSGSGRGRGSSRGRGRGGGRPSKRRRSGSEDSEGSDISASYTPLATTTKSGRNVQKPAQFSPPQPSSSPSGTKRKRGSHRVLESSVCKICRRGYSPTSNQIVFCDGCNTPYHQYCHDPSISSEVTAILDKEWFCTACLRSKEASPIKAQEPPDAKNKESPNTVSEERLPVVEPAATTFVSGERLSDEQKRAYLSAMSKPELVDLIVSVCCKIHPDIPLFDEKVYASSLNGDSSALSTIQSLRSITMPNITTSEHNPATMSSTGSHPEPTRTPPNSLLDKGKGKQPVTADTQAGAEMDDNSEAGYESDPPAHFPKPGNGLKLRQNNEELQWLIDDNFEVFSHIYKLDNGGDGLLEGEKKEGYALTAR